MERTSVWLVERRDVESNARTIKGRPSVHPHSSQPLQSNATQHNATNDSPKGCSTRSISSHQRENGRSCGWRQHTNQRSQRRSFFLPTSRISSSRSRTVLFHCPFVSSACCCTVFPSSTASRSSCVLLLLLLLSFVLLTLDQQDTSLWTALISSARSLRGRERRDF